jgi:putative transposase
MCKNRKNNLFIVNESYTSKTCGKCGEINNKLGSQSIFKCKTCKIEIDRDINAARNICIKNSVLL